MLPGYIEVRLEKSIKNRNRCRHAWRGGGAVSAEPPSLHGPNGHTGNGHTNVVASRYALIPESPVWRNRHLGPVTAELVRHAMLLYADKQGYCHPKVKTLAELFGVTPRAIQYHLATLERCHLVRRFARTGERGESTSNRIWVSRDGSPLPPDEEVHHPPGEEVLHPPHEAVLHPLRARATGNHRNRPFEQKKEEEGFQKNESGSSGRCAPLGEPSPTALAKLAAKKARLKVLRKDLRRAKVWRFIAETYTGDECTRRSGGMLGLDPDPARDEQWWFDHCDEEMKRANWDDRDRRQRA